MIVASLPKTWENVTLFEMCDEEIGVGEHVEGSGAKNQWDQVCTQSPPFFSPSVAAQSKV